MTTQIVAARRALLGRAARRILGQCALAAIGAGLGVASVSAFGADLATGSSRPVTGPSQVVHADHRPITVQPSVPPDTKLDHLAAQARMVDRLYEELMSWKLPECPPGSANASMAGRC